MGASSRLRFWRGKGELGPVSGLRLSLGLTVHNEGFRMYIPIRISSPVGEQAPACIPEIQRPLGSTRPALRWQVSLSPQSPAPQPLAGWVGRPWAPLPLQCDHMVSLCSLHSQSLESTFFLFVFLMVVVVIVSKVSPPLLLPWPPCPGSVSSSVTKAALDLGSLGREVAGSGSCSRCLFLVLLQPLPRWAHKWALSSKQNHPPPRPQRHVDPASPWEGGGDRRRRKRSKRAPLSRLTSLPHFPQPRFQSLTSYPPAAP